MENRFVYEKHTSLPPYTNQTEMRTRKHKTHLQHRYGPRRLKDEVQPYNSYSSKIIINNNNNTILRSSSPWFTILYLSGLDNDNLTFI